MSLWVDKFRPTNFQQLSHSPELTQKLQGLALNGSDMPHLMVYGPSGAGKKTRVHCLLKEMFGNGVDKMNIHNKIFTVTSGSSQSKIECTVVSSVYHLEMTPADNGGTQDRLVIQEIIKEIASMGNVIEATSTNDMDVTFIGIKRPHYKAVILHNADSLSQSAQHALRRTMEKFSKQIRLILIAENTSRIISPIRSRCLGIRVAAPSIDECVEILNHVAAKENVKINGDYRQVLSKFANASDQNLRRALLMLETAHVQSNYGFLTVDTKIPLPDYKEYLNLVAKVMLNEQNNQTVLKVRGMFYEILSKCIPAATILKELCFSVIDEYINRKGDGYNMSKFIVEQAALYDERLRLGTSSKSIFHLEAFTVKVMAEFKRISLNMN